MPVIQTDAPVSGLVLLSISDCNKKIRELKVKIIHIKIEHNMTKSNIGQLYSSGNKCLGIQWTGACGVVDTATNILRDKLFLRVRFIVNCYK